MTGFSKLQNVTRTIATGVCRLNLFNKPTTTVTRVITRSSHGRTMFIRPGKFYTKKYMDMTVIFHQKHMFLNLKM